MYYSDLARIESHEAIFVTVAIGSSSSGVFHAYPPRVFTCVFFFFKLFFASDAYYFQCFVYSTINTVNLHFYVGFEITESTALRHLEKCIGVGGNRTRARWVGAGHVTTVPLPLLAIGSKSLYNTSHLDMAAQPLLITIPLR